MDVRLIIKGSDRHYTMPVLGIDEIVWLDDTAVGSNTPGAEGGTLKCRRKGLDLLTIASDQIVTVYRDDGPPPGRGRRGAGSARRPRRTRAAPESEPTASDAEQSSETEPPA